MTNHGKLIKKAIKANLAFLMVFSNLFPIAASAAENCISTRADVMQHKQLPGFYRYELREDGGIVLFYKSTDASFIPSDTVFAKDRHHSFNLFDVPNHAQPIITGFETFDFNEIPTGASFSVYENSTYDGSIVPDEAAVEVFTYYSYDFSQIPANATAGIEVTTSFDAGKAPDGATITQNGFYTYDSLGFPNEAEIAITKIRGNSQQAPEHATVRSFVYERLNISDVPYGANYLEIKNIYFTGCDIPAEAIVFRSKNSTHDFEQIPTGAVFTTSDFQTYDFSEVPLNATPVISFLRSFNRNNAPFSAIVQYLGTYYTYFVSDIPEGATVDYESFNSFSAMDIPGGIAFNSISGRGFNIQEVPEGALNYVNRQSHSSFSRSSVPTLANAVEKSHSTFIFDEIPFGAEYGINRYKAYDNSNIPLGAVVMQTDFEDVDHANVPGDAIYTVTFHQSYDPVDVPANANVEATGFQAFSNNAIPPGANYTRTSFGPVPYRMQVPIGANYTLQFYTRGTILDSFRSPFQPGHIHSMQRLLDQNGLARIFSGRNYQSIYDNGGTIWAVSNGINQEFSLERAGNDRMYVDNYVGNNGRGNRTSFNFIAQSGFNEINRGTGWAPFAFNTVSTNTQSSWLTSIPVGTSVYVRGLVSVYDAWVGNRAGRVRDMDNYIPGVTTRIYAEISRTATSEWTWAKFIVAPYDIPTFTALNYTWSESYAWYEYTWQSFSWPVYEWTVYEWNSYSWPEFTWYEYSWEEFNWVRYNWNEYGWNSYEWRYYEWAEYSWSLFTWEEFEWNRYEWQEFEWNRYYWNEFVFNLYYWNEYEWYEFSWQLSFDPLTLDDDYTGEDEADNENYPNYDDDEEEEEEEEESYPNYNENDGNENQGLPQTGARVMNFILIGGFLMFASWVLIKFKKRSA